ncbi:MAG: hypothetical protein SNJ64_02725 [Endomicrobiia bacterium]
MIEKNNNECCIFRFMMEFLEILCGWAISVYVIMIGERKIFVR